MIDISKQIEHWRTGSAEDWEVARDLNAAGKLRHGLFFAHLALVKVLKAHVCRATNDLAPPTHNLVRLAAMTNTIPVPGTARPVGGSQQLQYRGTLPGYGRAFAVPK